MFNSANLIHEEEAHDGWGLRVSYEAECYLEVDRCYCGAVGLCPDYVGIHIIQHPTF